MYGDFFYALNVIMNNNVVRIVQEIKNEIAYFEKFSPIVKVDHIIARALNENNASITMLKKLGFEFIDKTPYEDKINGKSTEWQNFRITNHNGA